MTHAAHEVQIVNKQQYFSELTQRAAVAGPGDRIGVMSMNFAYDEPSVEHLLTELAGAAKRGATALLSVDAHDFIADSLSLAWGRRLQHGASPRHRALAMLREAGVQTIITNVPTVPFTPSIAGRSHIKFGVAGNRVWLGGCNLDNAANIDLMASWEDEQTADWLMNAPLRAAQAGSIRQAQNGEDITLPTTWGAELLVDAGVRGQSRILRTALQLIDEAQDHIIMTCQFFPNSVTARHLTQASKRGVDVTLIYNAPAKHAGVKRLLHTSVKYFQQHIRPAELFAHELAPSNEYLHAKLLVTEKAAMLGSHNYVMPGVTLGTAETTLLTTDRAFAEHALAALKAQLG